VERTDHWYRGVLQVVCACVCVCVIVCDLVTSTMRRPWPELGCCQKNIFIGMIVTNVVVHPLVFLSPNTDVSFFSYFPPFLFFLLSSHLCLNTELKQKVNNYEVSTRKQGILQMKFIVGFFSHLNQVLGE
jgi:hypothetical protein